jgi:sugar/nucleoside kinase (ribokinase family)
MSHSPRLFGLDSVMIDVVMMIGELPVPGGDSVSSRSIVTTGGGFNVMSAAARHGMSVVYAGRLGLGPFSQIARDSLREERIESPVEAGQGVDVGFCVVLIDATGERTFVTSPGAEGGLRTSDLQGLEVGGGDYVYLSGYNIVYPELGAVVSAWLATLSDEVVVAFDPGPRVMDIDPEALAETLVRTDWLLCNSSEAAWLTDAQSPESAAAALLARSARRGVVVRDGSAGCVVAARKTSPMRVGGFPVEVVDTNGAGDTHNGVFLGEVARGTDLIEAATRANAASAMAIAQFGPATCPTRDEVSEWFAEFS